MSKPRPLQDWDLEEVKLTRRILVREERESGWRTRGVDHETESMINPATRLCDKVQHDGIDLLAYILTFLMLFDVQPRLWKRDISSAFRRVPICAQHLEFYLSCLVGCRCRLDCAAFGNALRHSQCSFCLA